MNASNQPADRVVELVTPVRQASHRRLVVIAAVVGVLLASGAVLGWREWTHSPTYSLKAVAASVEHRDRYEFEKYVDIDGVLQSFIADSSDSNPLAGALGGALMTQLKPQIIKAIEEGSIPTESQLGRGIQKTLTGELPKIDRQGRNAYFEVPVATKGGAPFTLKVHLTQVPDGYWRIDRLANIKDLRAAEALEETARKVAIAKANEELLSKLDVTAKLHTSISEGWEKKNRFQVRFENKGDKAITNITGRIRLPLQEFDHGIKGAVEIAPGGTYNAMWEFDVNQFMKETVAVYRLGETENFAVEIESLTYSDGKTVTRGSEEPN